MIASTTFPIQPYTHLSVKHLFFPPTQLLRGSVVNAVSANQVHRFLRNVTTGMTSFQWSTRASPDEGNDHESAVRKSNLKRIAPASVSFPKLYMETHQERFSLDLDLNLKKPISHDVDTSPTLTKSRSIPSHPDSFFASMRATLLIFQCFGLMPLSGLTGYNHERISFKWIHWKMLYVLINLLGVLFLFTCSIGLCFRYGFSYDRSAPVVFYGSSVVNILLFISLAQKWNELNFRIAHTEDLLSSYGHPHGQGRKFITITILFVIFALTEHLLSKFVDFMRALPCTQDENQSDDPTYTFFLNQYYQVFSIINYHLILGILTLFFNFSATVVWNLTDLFLSLMSMTLSSRLKQINQHLMSVRGKEKPTAFWKKAREEFNALSVLVKLVDENIQKLMLLSLGDNLFFICLQLLKSIKQPINLYQSIYFFWSFGFLILRTAFVTLSASGVFDESRESKTVLYSVPPESFCHEARRFLTQLCTDELTLTGCRFFSVTRGLILTIAGTVVTYEIVLVQFKTDTGVEDWPADNNLTNCATLVEG